MSRVSFFFLLLLIGVLLTAGYSVSATSADDWWNKGLDLRDKGQNIEALEAFDQGLKIDPQDANLWFWRGTTLYDLARYDEALIALDLAIELDPDASLWFMKGITLKTLHRYKEAIEAYDQALKIDPKYDDAIKNREIALIEFNKSLGLSL